MCREILGQESSPSDWKVTGVNICHLYALALPYFFLVLVLEYANDGGSGGILGRALRWLQKLLTSLSLRWHGIRTDESSEEGLHYSLLGDDEGELVVDEDVQQERQYVLKNKEELRRTAPVVLLNLWKIYPPSVGVLGSILSTVRRSLSFLLHCCFDKKTMDSGDEPAEEKSNVPKQAVRGISTVIKKGETYALLGANGMSAFTAYLSSISLLSSTYIHFVQFPSSD